MKRYCLVSFCNIYVLPYAKLYIDAIHSSGAECDLVFWDRDASDGENDIYEGCRKLCYQKKITHQSSSKDKMQGYIEARGFILKKLKENDYDGIIFLQTHAAVASYPILKKKYKNKYIVDIRDYTLENFSFYRYMEKKVFSKSFATIISSPAYRRFLPDREYVIAHNYSPFPENIVKEIKKNEADKSEGPIQISFVGTVRFLDMDMKILKLFANDNRFKLNYFGSGSEALKEFCVGEGICNTEFYGSFSPDMTASFYKKTDLINNLYGNNTPFLDYALSNKLYHSAQFYIPVLVCPDTYMEEISQEYGMGFVFDPDRKDEKDRLFEWYRNLNRKDFAEGCDTFISNVKRENEGFKNILCDFLCK